MTEKQNIERLTKIYEAFGKRDISYIVDQLADDVRWFSHVDPAVPTSGDWSGKGKVPEFFRALDENMEISSFTPSEYVAGGDTVVSTGGFGGKSRTTGMPFESQWVFVWKFGKNKIVSYEQFHDWALATAFR